MNDIDLVIPMVFPQDIEWQKVYAMYKGSDAARHARYRSWDTEELMVRCCLEHMPWLRRIHILLAQESQVQPWMQEIKNERLNIRSQGSPEIHIVFHKDFMPEEYLPCFSSPCFEMFLGRIPGLAEHFIYANDDMFPLSPLGPEDFFRPAEDGTLLPCMVFNVEPFPARPNLFQRKCMYQLNMVGGPFRRRFKRDYLKSTHSFAPILRSSCEEVWRRHGEEIARSLSPLKRTDRSCNHYVFQLYQLFSGLYVEHCPREQYAGWQTPVPRLAAILRDPDAGIVCLNDNDNANDWRRRASVARREIAARLKKEQETKLPTI